eukprot:scaffold11972_cov134-Amphora_coffeaeformis.AAC.1
MAAKNQRWRVWPLGRGGGGGGGGGAAVVTKEKKKNKQGFTWHASVDRTTGKATAQEISRFTATTKQHNDNNNGSNRNRAGGAAALLAKTAPVLGQYPQWLCQGRVTLGLLRAKPATSSGGTTTSIQTRVGGINLLTFGKPVGQRMAVNTSHKAMSALLRQEAVQWKYPITSGLLVSRPGGSLILTLRQQQQPPSVVASSSSSSSPSSTLSPAPPPVVVVDAVIDTQFVDYRPRIVGNTVPANPLRVGFYLGTQSLVHGFVMWRFHRYVRHCYYYYYYDDDYDDDDDYQPPNKIKQQ